MKLTNKQQEISISLRQILGIDITDELCRADFPLIDFIRSVSQITEGGVDLITPDVMSDRFRNTWANYIKFWSEEHNRLLVESVGKDILDKIQDHPNCVVFVNRVIERIKSNPDWKPLMDVSKIKIDDIFNEEIGE